MDEYENSFAKQTAGIHERKPSTSKATSDGSSAGGYDTSPWKCGDSYIHEVNNAKEEWQECLKTVQKHDKAMVEAWRDEVQFLLIFSGLFSGVVTPFVVGSYKGLQPDSTQMTYLVLTQISAQLSTLGSQNPAPPFAIPPTQHFIPAGSSVRVNVFLFLSLTLSLSTALIAILCIQWLREYQREIPLQPQDAIALRQMRFEGLTYWKVPTILSLLPLLLQTSLLMFFVGLLNLLWSLNCTVAIVVTAAASVAVLFVSISTVLPSLQLLWTRDDRLRVPQCAFKSPQSWFYHRIVTWIICRATYKLKGRVHRVSRRLRRYWASLHDSNWVEYDINWWKQRNTISSHRHDSKPSDIANALHWVNRNYGQSVEHVHKLYSCFKSLPFDHAAQVLKLCYKKDKESVHEILSRVGTVPDVDLKKDAVSALFLELHRPNYPQFAPAHLELVIRVLNSHSSHPFLRWPTHDIFSLPSDTVDQFLMSIKSLIKSDQDVINDHIEPIWNLLHLVLSNPRSIKKERIVLTFDIIHEVQMWLGRSPKESLSTRVKACTYGMMRVQPLLRSFKPDSGVRHALDFMKVLDKHIAVTNRESNVIGPTANIEWNKRVGRNDLESYVKVEINGKTSDLGMDEENLDEKYPESTIDTK